METCEVRFSQEALDDLAEIVHYIAQNSRAAAHKMRDTIIEKANDLSLFPRRGRPVPDAKMQKSGFRMLPIKPYIAFYRVIDNMVLIYRVIHGATNCPLLCGKISEMATSEDSPSWE
jgi:addiction module RelE/StbE family toxin